MNRYLLTHRHLARALMLGMLLSLAGPTSACDSDADCGSGGTCIKREKRARGVCYGRSANDELPAADSALPATGAVAPRPVSGERRRRATEMLGDPDALIRENLPGSEAGATCMLNQDCPQGSECVIAGFEGRCIKL